MVVVELTQLAPSKYCVVEQLDAILHFSAFGIPKSGFDESPAPGIQMLAPERTLTHACLSCSILAGSASVLI